MNALALLSQFGIRITGLMHVGANTGDEAPSYAAARVPTVIYVEPTPAPFAVLKARIAGAPGHHAVQAVCSSTAGDSVAFNVASNNAESSSLFALGNHGILYPDIAYTERLELTTTTVDGIVEAGFAGQAINLLVIDVQGAELLVLRGAERALETIDAVFCEVADISLYEGSCTWPEIDAFLSEKGFRLKHLQINAHNWGDALFVKEAAYASALRRAEIPRPGIDIARGKPATQSSLSPFSTRDDALGAVDGTLTGKFGFHTDLEDRPWWQVDLLEVVVLEEVIVFNRLVVGPFEISAAQIFFGAGMALVGGAAGQTSACCGNGLSDRLKEGCASRDASGPSVPPSGSFGSGDWINVTRLAGNDVSLMPFDPAGDNPEDCSTSAVDNSHPRKEVLHHAFPCAAARSRFRSNGLATARHQPMRGRLTPRKRSRVSPSRLASPKGFSPVFDRL